MNVNDEEGDITIVDFHADVYGFWPVIEKGSLYLSVGGGFAPEPDDPIVHASIGFRYWLIPYFFINFAPSVYVFVGRGVGVLGELSIGLTLPGRR